MPKSKPINEHKTIQTAFRLDSITLAELDTLAKDLRTNRSETLRQVIRREALRVRERNGKRKA